MAPRTKDKTEVEHFRAKCVRAANGCLEFTGCPNCRRPTFRFQGRSQVASRVAWQIAHGPIPGKLEVCHTCDNPRCVDEAAGHLFLGTQADNNADMARKGRHGATRNPWEWAAKRFSWEGWPGESNPAAKLSAADVAALRKRRKQGAPYSVLVAEFAISKSQVARIVKGQSWQ